MQIIVSDAEKGSTYAATSLGAFIDEIALDPEANCHINDILKWYNRVCNNKIMGSGIIMEKYSLKAVPDGLSKFTKDKMEKLYAVGDAVRLDQDIRTPKDTIPKNTMTIIKEIDDFGELKVETVDRPFAVIYLYHNYHMFHTVHNERRKVSRPDTYAVTFIRGASKLDAPSDITIGSMLASDRAAAERIAMDETRKWADAYGLAQKADYEDIDGMYEFLADNAKLDADGPYLYVSITKQKRKQTEKKPQLVIVTSNGTLTQVLGSDTDINIEMIDYSTDPKDYDRADRRYDEITNGDKYKTLYVRHTDPDRKGE